jgi:hypothetical protein
VAETGERHDRVAEVDDDEARQAWQRVGTSPELTAVYEADALGLLYASLLGFGDFTPLPHCTWLRAKGPGLHTAPHSDFGHFVKDTQVFSQYALPPPRAHPTEGHKVSRGDK